jgi:hypothetical protein
MNDRQRAIIEAVVDDLMPHVQGRSRDQVEEALYNLVLDCRQPPRLAAHEPSRRRPAAGELLPPHQRASWTLSLPQD